MDPEDEHVPGTQRLVESATGNQDVVLIPQPSDDPDDPLNWSSGRKWLATFCWALYVLVNGVTESNLYSILVPFSEDQNIPLSTLNAGTGYLFLLAGWGLIFWIPLALQGGKRPVYLLSLLGIMAITLWTPYCTTSGQWYARSILSGFFASPIEALPELSVADLYFTHERGFYLGLYSFVLVGSNFLSPVIFGFVNDNLGWRWAFWLPAIFCGCTAIILFFLAEETNFDRPGVSTAQQIAITSLDSKEIQTEVETNVWTVRNFRQRSMISRKSYLSRLSLWDSSRPFTMHKRFVTQLQYLLWPVPVYSGVCYGSTLVWFNVFNATSSLVLSSPPYDFSSSIVGLSYLAPLVGVMIAFLFVGRFSDALVLRLSRRNGGIMEPEFRLWVLVLNVVFIPAGLLLWGVGSSHGIQWVGLLFAMGMLGFQNTCGASLSVNYLIDSYRAISGDALTTVILVRNTMSFAINYGITPWITNLGRQDCFISAAVIGAFVAACLLLMIKFGKRARRKTASWYWKQVSVEEDRQATR